MTQVCAEPGCPELTERTYCISHARARDARRPGRHQRGYDARWQRTRRTYLAAHPWCECDTCAALPVSQRLRSVDVDHRDGLGPLAPRGHDWSNLRAMAHDHHSQRTARDHPAGTAAWRSAP